MKQTGIKEKGGPLIFPVLIMVFFLPSCSARISGSLGEDGSGQFTLEATLENRMTALIRSLSALASPAPSPDAPVIDGPAIAASMAAAPGMRSVFLYNTAPAAIEGDIQISRIDEFLSLPGGGGRFISYTPVPGLLSITLDRSSGPRIIALLSTEAVDYLSALMAPVVTGEQLSREEYLNLVGSVYSKAIADEIAAARLSITVDFPGPLQSVRGGTFSGSRAEFLVPLADLFVLDRPLEYEARWRRPGG